MSDLRLGAYVLAADPTWIRSSLARYYDHLDDLVVSASESGRGWTGVPVSVEECLAALREIDVRGIVRVVRGEWIDPLNPMVADTAQRQAALDAVGSDVDWVLQFDTDELLPSVPALLAVLDRADELGIGVVEWPMRVLYRKLARGRFLEIVARDGRPRYDYPGPIAVRPGTHLIDARRAGGAYLRPVVQGDDVSLQIARAAEPDEVREVLLTDGDAIVHNSWARAARSVHRKVRSWGHGGSLRAALYYWLVWLPTPFLWRIMRDIHPFARGLWPRLAVLQDVPALDPRDLRQGGGRS